MPGEILELDPISEDASNISLLLSSGSPPNLLANPGFEVDTSGWTLGATSWASSSLTRSALPFEGSAGSWVGQLQATKDATITSRTITLAQSTANGAISPGATYAFSFLANIVDGVAGGLQTYINWYTSEVGLIESGQGFAQVTGTGIHTLSTTPVVAPPTAALAQIVIQITSVVSGDTVDMRFDNATLQTLSPTGFRLMAHDYPTPARAVNWASNADTEGELPANLRYQNRTIALTVRIYGTSVEDALTQISRLEQKVGKINREQGTLKRTTGSGQVIVFDLLEAAADITQDNDFLANFRSVATITFTARPFGRGAETALTEHSETTLPCLVFVDNAPKGDVPSLARLVVSEGQNVNQLTLLWGMQSRYYSTASTAELFYQAESRKLLSGATAVSQEGASGTFSNTAFFGSLLPSYQAILGMQSSGGAALSHVGTFRVFARVYRPTSNTGAVSVALEWGPGDFLRTTRNEPVTYPANELEGEWTIADLGLVHLEEVTLGAQQWEGQIVALSTANGDDIYIDCVMLFPVDEGYGELKVVPSLTTPTSMSAHDEFEQGGGGTLSGKTAPVGGTWSEAGHAGSFNLDSTNHYVTRTAVSDEEGEGRVGILGSTSFTNIIVGADIYVPGDPGGGDGNYGVVCRYSSITKGFYAWFNAFHGAEPDSWCVSTGGFFGNRIKSGNFATQVHDQWNRLRVVANANGNWQFWFNGVLLASGFYAPLATGGELATGKVGIYDQHPQFSANTRYYDNFVAYPPAFDAALFAKQTAEIGWDRMQRANAAGTEMTPRPDYKGSYLRMPVEALESRKVRTIVKLSRGNIDTSSDSAIDDLSAQLHVRPRYLVVPQP